MAKKQDYMVRLTSAFCDAAREEMVESIRAGKDRKVALIEHVSKLRAGFEAIKPEIDKVLAENGGKFLHGGVDYGVADASGQYCDFMVIKASKTCAKKIEAIKGVGGVWPNSPVFLIN
jgi:hypothetical protein